jgi:hypothetical protein
VQVEGAILTLLFLKFRAQRGISIISTELSGQALLPERYFQRQGSLGTSEETQGQFTDHEPER